MLLLAGKINNFKPSHIFYLQFMDSPPTKLASSVTKDEETTSRASSITQRLQRKREQRSIPRRSHSRKSLESKQSSLQISKFYTKMARKQPQILLTPTRQRNVIACPSQKEIKRRSPTPLPGRGKHARVSKSPNNEMDKEIQIAELTRKLENEKIRKTAVQNRAETFQKELRQKIRKIKELQQELTALKSNSKQANASYQSQARIQKSMNQSGVQRLKANFLQIRIQELQKANGELTKQLILSKSEIERFRAQYEALKEQNELFKHEIFTLNQQSESALLSSKQREINILKQKINLSTSQRQVFLDNLLDQCESQKLGLQNRIRYLQLKIAFINRKQNQELRDITRKKDKEIAAIRRKLSILACQSLKFKKQAESNKVRQSLITQYHSRSFNSESCSFSLSPEHDSF